VVLLQGFKRPPRIYLFSIITVFPIYHNEYVRRTVMLVMRHL